MVEKNRAISEIIAVDLDGTLVNTDTLHESILALLCQRPFFVFLIPFWIFLGKAGFKAKISNHVELEISMLPFHWELIEWLKIEKNNGKFIILCTGANNKIANSIANYLEIFNDVISSDEDINLTGRFKSKALISRFGYKRFDYIGNSITDIVVWASAKNAILVNTTKSIEEKAKKVSNVSIIFTPESSNISRLFQTLRLGEWFNISLFFSFLVLFFYSEIINNFFIFIFSFISICFCTSIAYIVDDLLSLQDKRKEKNNSYGTWLNQTNYIKFHTLVLFILIIIIFLLSLIVSIQYFFYLIIYLFLMTYCRLRKRRAFLIDYMLLTATFMFVIIITSAEKNLKYSSTLLLPSFFFHNFSNL
jgi:hypothetical protein